MSVCHPLRTLVRMLQNHIMLKARRLTTIVLFVAALIGQHAFAQSAASRIAYIGPDRNIYSLDPDSMHSTQVTSDAGSSPTRAVSYGYPTWSSSGDLAFIKFAANPGGRPMASIVTHRSGMPLHVEDDLEGVSPFYLYYSPSGRYLSVLGTTLSGPLGLLLLPNEGPPRIVATGQPFYWAWLPGDEEIVMHTGGATVRDSLYLHSVASQDSIRFPASPGPFQAPAVSPRGEYVALALRDEGSSSSLVISNRDSTIYESFPQIEGVQAFDWSPTEDLLAVVDGQQMTAAGNVGELRLVDMRVPTRPVVRATGIEDAGIFFWSPDGSRIAIFRPRLAEGPQGRFLLLSVGFYDVEEGTLRDVVSIVPGRDFLSQVVPFYDQYQRSATIWFPDSTRIVVSSRIDAGPPVIFLVSASDEEEFELPPAPPSAGLSVSYHPVRHDGLPRGLYAFWSW